VLHNLDEENERHIYVSLWFIVCHNTLTNFGETLTLDDIVVREEATQAGSSCAIDELESSNR
jgi:hypothetical protein